MNGIWFGLRTLIGLVFPAWGMRRRGSMVLALHLPVLALILGGLWYLNGHWRLERSLFSPFPLFHRVWLPLLFFLAYALSWIAAWLCVLLGPGAFSARLLDLDEAWAKARAALDRAGLDLTERPLFLVLGRPVEEEPPLFGGAGMSWKVQGTPRGPSAPFHFYAGQDGIFIVWRETGFHGQPTSLRDPAALEQQRARLSYLCRLIQRDRLPYCPINGLLALVPFPALQDEGSAERAGLSLNVLLQTARVSLQVECPTTLLITDLQQAPGFCTFLEKIPPDRRTKLLGQPFALVPDLDSSEAPAMFEAGINGFIQGDLWNLLEPCFQVEADATALRKNGDLYRFWESLHLARGRLARLLAQSAQSDDAPPLVTGCFLAANGVEQAFLPGVFRLLPRNQNLLTWTPRALADEQSFLRSARWAYVAFVVLLLALGGLIATGP